MLLKTKLLTILLVAVIGSVQAQQDKLVTHFIFDKMSINPGKTGLDLYNGICATSIYRNQWDKVNGAPNSAILNIESNLSRFLPGGIGINFYHDAIGFSRQNNLLLNYSYPIQIGREGVLGVGVGIGIMNFGMDPEWVPPTQVVDPTLPVGFAATAVDANFGLYFQSKDYYVGISSTHLTESDLSKAVSQITQSYQTARHYYLMGGYKFKDVMNGTIDAQMLVRTDFIRFSADLNARYLFKLDDKDAYGGLTFRTSDAIAVMLGYSPMPKLQVGYSYDITVNKIASISRGSHELMVKYCYFIPPPPKTKARHPRLL
ncbi:MAG: PorP/SprF family type IX secretion system membrane protein [Crocinitomicaceae bacterium]|jgi:type IX secretion system PorP/SprF family membrane protein|nr:PorP/SprF family type IX secretion system membrane protein [Crocinitomicaceae bacterium]MDP4760066.1 PorP/SprF family type IX secretion system membrane protein [Crocinitomicaceae bacterium]